MGCPLPHYGRPPSPGFCVRTFVPRAASRVVCFDFAGGVRPNRVHVPRREGGKCVAPLPKSPPCSRALCCVFYCVPLARAPHSGLHACATITAHVIQLRRNVRCAAPRRRIAPSSMHFICVARRAAAAWCPATSLREYCFSIGFHCAAWARRVASAPHHPVCPRVSVAGPSMFGGPSLMPTSQLTQAQMQMLMAQQSRCERVRPLSPSASLSPRHVS